MSVTLESIPTVRALGQRWEVANAVPGSEPRPLDFNERVIAVCNYQPRGYIRPQWSVVVRQTDDWVTGEWSDWHVGVINHTRGGLSGEWLGLSGGGRDTDEWTIALVDALDRARDLARELNA